MSALPDGKAPAASSKSNRALTVILDGLCGLLGVASVAYLVVELARPIWPIWALTLLAAWTVLISTVSLPAIAVLYFSAPRVPLKQRSSLVASASWFGRAVWAAVVFALSIVVGAVAGVVASGVNESSQDAGNGIALALEATASLVLWPAILVVVGVAYIVMGARWVFDLGTIMSEGGGADVRALLERRWTGPLLLSAGSAGILSTLLEFGIAGISRLALALTLVTIGLSVALVATNWH